MRIAVGFVAPALGEDDGDADGEGLPPPPPQPAAWAVGVLAVASVNKAAVAKTKIVVMTATAVRVSLRAIEVPPAGIVARMRRALVSDGCLTVFLPRPARFNQSPGPDW